MEMEKGEKRREENSYNIRYRYVEQEVGETGSRFRGLRTAARMVDNRGGGGGDKGQAGWVGKEGIERNDLICARLARVGDLSRSIDCDINLSGGENVLPRTTGCLSVVGQQQRRYLNES